MALFSKADLPKSKYIVSIVAKIKKGTAIKVKDGKSYKFKKTKDIDMLEKVQTNFQKYNKILYLTIVISMHLYLQMVKSILHL